jgi:TIR domain
MGVNDDFFWDDLLGHIREQVLVPVVGPDLTVVNLGDTEETLTTLVGQRLAKKYELTVSPGTTMDEAVATLLRERKDEVGRLYIAVNNIIKEIIQEHPAPSDPLRNLAAITDLRFFVSTTPDRLLAQAVNEVRFQGRREARELTFSPSQSTSEQQNNGQPAAATDTVVLSLFGKAASLPQYAIHEEDRLEWLHALLSDTASLPEWLGSQLKRQPMLFVGCEIPDWIGRFLLRMSSNTRLSSPESKQVFFVGSSAAHEPSLSDFFATYCRKAQVQQLEMAPTAFVKQLRDRWEKQRLPEEDGDGPLLPRPDATIFISYMREDADAARQLDQAITEGLFGDVWLDERQIRPGNTWQRDTLTAIRQTIRLFIPVISENTENTDEGYVFREWKEAVKRSLSIEGRDFIVPVIVDKDYDPDRYRRIPDEFKDLHFGHAPAGNPDKKLLATLTHEIRNMRRAGAR